MGDRQRGSASVRVGDDHPGAGVRHLAGWLVDAGKSRPQDWAGPTGENLKVGA